MANEFINPFPGMNPYFEAVPWWREVHNSLIGEIRYVLRETLPARYRVTMEERATIVYNPPTDPPRRYAIIPDVTISGQRDLAEYPSGQLDGRSVTVVLPDISPAFERFIQINIENRHEAITIIEILSPTNKHAGRGRDDYLQKRNQILNSSTTHLVEVDLLRDGIPMPVQGYEGNEPYRLLVSRNELRPSAELYPVGLRSRIPTIKIPLLDEDEEPTIDLSAILDDIYLRGYMGRNLDYGIDPSGPLDPDDRQWLDQLLREKGLRT